MCVWLIIAVCKVLNLVLQGKCLLGKYFRKYDIVDCFVSIPPRSKRSAHEYNGKVKYKFDAEVQFRSYQTDFHLLLTEDAAFQKLKVESYSSNDTIRLEKIKMRIYEGVLNGKSLSSHVIGYLQNNLFVGTIKSNETVYFVESASKFLPNLTLANKIIVYREEDIAFLRDISRRGITTDIFSRIRKKNNMNELLPKGINKTENPNEEYACRIELVSDHTLFDYFEGNIESLTCFLYLHAKYSDLIFRGTDFDGNGERDHIRIITDKIFIYKSKSDPKYPMAETPDMFSFLEMFSLRTQNYCLSLCISNRYSTKVLGEAFMPELYKEAFSDGLPGGICQKSIVTYRNGSLKITESLNTAVVTIQHKNVTLPLAGTILTVAHELGHSFGSDHDKIKDLYCSPGGRKGFYLMHEYIEMKPLISFFSPCSRKSIASVIHARGECLKPYPATCGNGVQEGDEDCDCGNHISCLFLDPCCTPSDVKPPENGCTFRKLNGSICSAKENICCRNKCTVITDTEFLCFNDDIACQISYCDGKKATCPKPIQAPDKYPCYGTSKTCSGGMCNSSVCLDNGLEDCVCKNIFECAICCLKDSLCVTASSLRFLTLTGERYFELEGTPCNSDKYQCDGSGNCVNPFNRDESIVAFPSKWFTIGVSTFILFVVLSVLGYFAKQLITKG